METVELYCELLLARANVLDQVAFGEKGVRARSRAREEKVRNEVGKRQGGGAGAAPKDSKGNESGSSSRGLFGFPFFGGGQQKQKSENAHPSSGSAKDDADLSPEELCYIDPAIDEAAAVVFYAWPRFPHDVRELNIVRTMLADRYGKDFMALAQENKVEHVKVPERVAKSLRVRPPTQDLVELYLKEIAKAYGITWGEGQQEDLGNAPEFVDDRPSTPHDQQSDGGNGDSPEDKTRRASDTNELNKATPPRRPVQSGKSPVSVAPPGPRTDNPNPRVKVPRPSSSEDLNNTASKSTSDTSKANEDPNRIPEVDELSRRFAELRRKP